MLSHRVRSLRRTRHIEAKRPAERSAARAYSCQDEAHQLSGVYKSVTEADLNRRETRDGTNETVGSGLSWNETLQLVCPVLDHNQLR